jgi:hypothetical protein
LVFLIASEPSSVNEFLPPGNSHNLLLFNHPFTGHSGIARFTPTAAVSSDSSKETLPANILWALSHANTRGMPILVRARWAAWRLPFEPLMACMQLRWALGRPQARNYSTPRSRLVILYAPQSDDTRRSRLALLNAEALMCCEVITTRGEKSSYC